MKKVILFILLPIIALIEYIFVLGLTLGLSAINIYIKDTEYIVQFFINMLFYGTPILYSATLFPEKIRWILYLNPMAQIIDAYRNIFLYHHLPSISGMIYVIIITMLIFFIGLGIFRKLEKGFAEEV